MYCFCLCLLGVLSFASCMVLEEDISVLESSFLYHGQALFLFYPFLFPIGKAKLALVPCLLVENNSIVIAFHFSIWTLHHAQKKIVFFLPMNLILLRGPRKPLIKLRQHKLKCQVYAHAFLHSLMQITQWCLSRTWSSSYSSVLWLSWWFFFSWSFGGEGYSLYSRS